MDHINLQIDPRRHDWRRSVLCICLPLVCMLQGCLDAVPQQVEQHIIIERDGRFEMTYSGSFSDLSELAKVSKETAESQEKLSSEAFEALRGSAHLEELRKAGGSLYTARWRLKANLLENEKPDGLSKLEHMVGDVPLQFDRLRQVENGYRTSDNYEKSLRGVQEMLNKKEPKAEFFKKLIRGYTATITVEIDNDLVGYSNATSKRLVRPGRSLHQWKIKFEGYRPPIFAFAVGENIDLKELKLASALEGTSCAALIGGPCKCGPFVAKDPDHKPMAGLEYWLYAGKHVVHGHTDAAGVIPAQFSQKTGGCYVRLK